MDEKYLISIQVWNPLSMIRVGVSRFDVLKSRQIEESSFGKNRIHHLIVEKKST